MRPNWKQKISVKLWLVGKCIQDTGKQILNLAAAKSALGRFVNWSPRSAYKWNGDVDQIQTFKIQKQKMQKTELQHTKT